MHIDDFIPITQAKSRLLEVVREIDSLNSVVAITKNGVPATVMLSMEQYESLMETLSVLADENAMRMLKTALQEEQDGKPFVDLEDIE